MSNIEQLVGNQVVLGELRRRLEPGSAGVRGERPTREAYGPCLVVSREFGSGGVCLAQMVNEQLKWQIFDRELVEEVARTAHVRRQLVESVDQRVRSGWSELGRKLSEGEGLGLESYLHYLRQVILALGHHGHVIIIGRGAHYILPPECAVRVRLVAPLEMRARRLAEREDISFPKALRRVVRTDMERAAFVRKAFGKDVNSAEDYDLVLNTAECRLEAAAEIVLEKLQAKLHVPLGSVPCGT